MANKCHTYHIYTLGFEPTSCASMQRTVGGNRDLIWIDTYIPEERKCFEPKWNHHGQRWRRQRGGGQCHRYHTSGGHLHKFATTFFIICLWCVISLLLSSSCCGFVFDFDFDFGLYLYELVMLCCFQYMRMRRGMSHLFWFYDRLEESPTLLLFIQSFNFYHSNLPLF